MLLYFTIAAAFIAGHIVNIFTVYFIDHACMTALAGLGIQENLIAIVRYARVTVLTLIVLITPLAPGTAALRRLT